MSHPETSKFASHTSRGHEPSPPLQGGMARHKGGSSPRRLLEAPPGYSPVWRGVTSQVSGGAWLVFSVCVIPACLITGCSDADDEPVTSPPSLLLVDQRVTFDPITAGW